MVFTIAYRDNGGQRTWLELDVPTRDAVWAELRKRGISAISISHGAAPKSAKRRCVNEHPQARSFMSCKVSCLSIAGAAILVGLAVFLFRTKEYVPAMLEPSPRNKANAIRSPAKDIQTKEISNAQAEELKLPELSGRYIERRTTVSAPPPLSDLQSILANNAPKKTSFQNGAEQLMALAMPSQPGASVPPLPMITDESLADEVNQAMSHVLKAEEGDTETLLERKLLVTQAKSEFIDLRDKEGFTFAEYLNALRDQANLDADFLAEAHKISNELYHDQAISDETYLQYRNQINEKLKERGLPEIE